jgi:hypothetical protein
VAAQLGEPGLDLIAECRHHEQNDKHDRSDQDSVLNHILAALGHYFCYVLTTKIALKVDKLERSWFNLG